MTTSKNTKMAEALKVVQITPHTLKIWEKELQLQIPRDEKGHRVFSRDWIRFLETVKEKLDQGWDYLRIIYNIDSPAKRARELHTAVGPEY